MSAIVCPQCVEAGIETPLEDVETQVRTVEGESLDSFVEGLGEFETIEEITGWRVVPCGHDYPVSEWVILIDETGVRFHKRSRVMLFADDGEVTPA
jgi:hypothetical protein